MFRYELWTYDGTGDKYEINSYAFSADVTPADATFSLEVEQDAENLYYRVMSSGELAFSRDDFPLFEDVLDECDPHLIKVFDSCNVSRSDFLKGLFWNSADYIGIVKKTNTKIDYDRCVAFVQLDTFDVYTRLLRELSENRGLFGSRVRTYISYFEYTIDDFSEPTESPTQPATADPLYNDGTDPEPDKQYTILNRFWSTKTPENTWIGIKTWIREYALNNSATVPPDGSGNWIYFGVFGSSHKWVRYPILPQALGGNLSTASYDYEEVVDDTVEWTLGLYGVEYNTEPKDVAVHYKSRLNVILGQIGYTEMESRFLDQTTNPVTGERNDLNHLLLFQQSDVKNRTDKATRFDMTLQEMLDYLKFINAYWYIEFINNQTILYIEHRKFFDNGWKYTPLVSHTMSPDTNRLVIDTDISKLEKSTIFEIGTNGTVSFRPREIIYDGGCTGDSDLPVNVEPMTTDFPFIQLNENDVSDEGVVLVASKAISGSGYRVHGDEIEGGRWAINGQLAMFNIQNKYWFDGTPTLNGKVYSANVTFNYKRKSKQRANFFWQLPYKSLDPRGLIITDYGLAKVSSAIFKSRGTKWEMILNYE